MESRRYRAGLLLLRRGGEDCDTQGMPGMLLATVVAAEMPWWGSLAVGLGGGVIGVLITDRGNRARERRAEQLGRRELLLKQASGFLQALNEVTIAVKADIEGTSASNLRDLDAHYRELQMTAPLPVWEAAQVCRRAAKAMAARSGDGPLKDALEENVKRSRVAFVNALRHELGLVGAFTRGPVRMDLLHRPGLDDSFGLGE